VTTKCALHRSSFFEDIFGEDIYVLDTPGLDSRGLVHLVVEEIDEMIHANKLQIVGIAYVLDIKQR
jgi:hypothetical protein